MNSKCIILTAGLLISNLCYSQVTSKPTILYFGLGAGLDYGGLGVKAEFMPVKHIGIFAGAGYNFCKIGYNGGVSWKLLPDKKSTPTLMAMYGYNGVLRPYSFFSGTMVYEKVYYGPSVGGGYEFHLGKSRTKIALSLVVPIRSSAFKEAYKKSKDLSRYFKPEVSNVLGTIGINFGASSNK